jgi:hypothetical protein
MIWITSSEKDTDTATRASAKIKLAKPDRRSVGETELHYLWIQLIYSALKNGEAGTSGGRAGFVMANSASDAGSLNRNFAASSSKVAPRNAGSP